MFDIGSISSYPVLLRVILFTLVFIKITGDCCGCAGGHGSANAPGNELGLQYGLYQKIDKDNVQCLNEVGENSGRTIFKPWHERLCRERVIFTDF